jgi:hypothetical protein
MATSREDVADFLNRFKFAVQARLCSFVPRPRLSNDLARLNLTENAALDLICSLTPENYSSGPMPDDTDQSKEVWIFDYALDDTELYIKLRLVPQKGGPERGSVWSFHKAERPLKYPLRIK